ncbi:MAG: hypothetical protein JWM96_1299 [Alphaproteobacteria bacterium]|nr:hypothetical protein [Alphaproteobacteria bacterium]
MPKNRNSQSSKKRQKQLKTSSEQVLPIIKTTQPTLSKDSTKSESILTTKETSPSILESTNKSIWKNFERKEVLILIGGAATAVGLSLGSVTAGIQLVGFDMTLAHLLIFLAWFFLVAGVVIGLFVWERLGSIHWHKRGFAILAFMVISGVFFTAIDIRMVNKKAETDKKIAEAQSIAELKQEVAKLVSDLHSFYAKWENLKPPIGFGDTSEGYKNATTREEQNRIIRQDFYRQKEALTKWSTQYQNEYNREFYTKAYNLRDEMLKRIPPDKIKNRKVNLSWMHYERLSGVNPVAQIASDLEELASLLPN